MVGNGDHGRVYRDASPSFSYVAEVVASDPQLRDDLRICRELGVTLRRFLNVQGPTDPDYDDWERALWRAFHEWEAGRCPGCGQPFEDSLWDETQSAAERARWVAGFVECRACEVLELAQGVQQARDDTENERRRKQQGDRFVPVPARHRHWQVTRDDERGR